MLRLLITALLLFPFTGKVSGTAEEGSDFPQIRKESSKLSKAIANEDLSVVLEYNIPETMILPEYQSALETPSEIKDFYTQFFALSETKKHTKKIIEILQFGDYFQEIGTFEHTYKILNEDWFTYRGKYMTWWTTLRNGDLKVLANIWGGSSWHEPRLLNFVQIETVSRPALVPNTPLEHKIVESINAATKAVKAGDGEKQIEGYLEDAIYMTYYDPPLIGKSAIADYFLTHYDPKVKNDSLVIKPYRVLEMGDYSLQLNKYYVEWTYEGTISFVHGKGLNLRKQTKDGSLKLYRQFVNHSIPPTPIEHLDKMKIEEILSILDDQGLSVEDQLKVFTEHGLEHFPPNVEKITSLEELRAHLLESRASGTTEIKHSIEKLSSYSDIVLMTGKTTGKFKPKNKNNFYRFGTKNLFVFKRMNDGSLKISKVIWNMVAPERN